MLLLVSCALAKCWGAHFTVGVWSYASDIGRCMEQLRKRKVLLAHFSGAGQVQILHMATSCGSILLTGNVREDCQMAIIGNPSLNMPSLMPVHILMPACNIHRPGCA